MKNNEKVISSAKSSPAIPSTNLTMIFRKLTGNHFDFELKPDQKILFLPYTSLLYDKKNQVYWIYVVIITPGKPNKYYRCWSYDLQFSVMNLEETNAHYGAVAILPNGKVINIWHEHVEPNFVTRMAMSDDGVKFNQYTPMPNPMNDGEDKNVYIDEETGRVYQFTRNDRPARENRRQSLRYSDNNGLTWSEKTIVLEIKDSQFNDPNSKFYKRQVYSMTVCKHGGKYLAAVNILNDLNLNVTVKMAESDDLYNWTWMNEGNDLVLNPTAQQQYAAICSYKDIGVNDAPNRLLLLVQDNEENHNGGGIFRIGLFEKF